MIQRIQSFYLLIVTGLLITAICLPMGYFTDTTGEHPFKVLGINVNGIFQPIWGIFGILMLNALTAFATIFLHKNRMLQIRIPVFNSSLLVGHYTAFIAFHFALKSDVNLFHIGWALCLPLMSIVLNVLVIHAIGRDRVMVKTVDRLR